MVQTVCGLVFVKKVQPWVMPAQRSHWWTWFEWGTKKVLKKYNCTYLRTAAINVTKITTEREPHQKQIVYGGQALDLSFDFGGISGGRLADGEFDMAAFFGEERPIRITTVSSPAMIRQRMIDLFWEDEQFTEDVAMKMKKVMLEDLNSNRKEEYMSGAGLITVSQTPVWEEVV